MIPSLFRIVGILTCKHDCSEDYLLITYKYILISRRQFYHNIQDWLFLLANNLSSSSTSLSMVIFYSSLTRIMFVDSCSLSSSSLGPLEFFFCKKIKILNPQRIDGQAKPTTEGISNHNSSHLNCILHAIRLTMTF